MIFPSGLSGFCLLRLVQVQYICPIKQNTMGCVQRRSLCSNENLCFPGPPSVPGQLSTTIRSVELPCPNYCMKYQDGKPQPKWISKWCRQHPKCPCEHPKKLADGPIWTHIPYYKPVIHSDPFGSGPWSIMLDLSLARSFPGSTKSNLKEKKPGTT